MKKLIGFLLVTMILTACQADLSTPPVVETPLATGEETLFVAPFWQTCVGVVPMLCMQVKNSVEDNWTYFYDQIEGFTYEPGFSYELLVKKEDVENPPADDSSINWILVEEVSKSPVEMPRMDLTGTEWNLVSNQGNAPIGDTGITLLFEEEGQFGGSSGCNNYFGGYEHNGFSFSTTGPLASTLMACEEQIMNQETNYLTKLDQIEYIQVEDGRLLLVSPDGLYLEYEEAK